MKNVSAGFMTMLATSQQILSCDLYTITLRSGAVARIATAPQNIVVAGNTYLTPASGATPALKRGPIRLALGLAVESIEVTMSFDDATTFAGSPPGAFAIAGGLDGARIKIDKLLTPDLSDTSRGVVNLFNGTVSEVDVASTSITMNVDSDLVYLNAAFPRNYLLPSCNNAFCDTSCGLTKASQTVSGTCTAGNTKTHLKASAITTGTYALGYVTITSGANAGLVRSVKTFTSGDFELLYPLPQACATGDTFTATKGCDKTEAMCDTYGNRARFRGYPFVPTPEQLEMGGSTGRAPNDNAGNGAGLSGAGRGTGGQRTKFNMQ